jgi:hypothetical protein
MTHVAAELKLIANHRESSHRRPQSRLSKRHNATKHDRTPPTSDTAISSPHGNSRPIASSNKTKPATFVLLARFSKSTNGWLYGDFDLCGIVDNTTDYDLCSTGFAHQVGALRECGITDTGYDYAISS